jgi:hypothetical protein
MTFRAGFTRYVSSVNAKDSPRLDTDSTFVLLLYAA